MAVTKASYRFIKTRTPNLVRWANTGEYYVLYKLNGRQLRKY